MWLHTANQLDLLVIPPILQLDWLKCSASRITGSARFDFKRRRHAQIARSASVFRQHRRAILCPASIAVLVAHCIHELGEDPGKQKSERGHAGADDTDVDLDC